LKRGNLREKKNAVLNQVLKQRDCETETVAIMNVNGMNHVNGMNGGLKQRKQQILIFMCWVCELCWAFSSEFPCWTLVGRVP